MQAVILAAGRGTRMGELTSAVPKPMLDLNGRPLLEYKLGALPAEVSEVVLVIGYHGDVVRNHFGASFDGREIEYVEQKEFDGTAGALWSAQAILKDRFLVMMGDDIYAKEDVLTCMEPSQNWRLLVQEISEMRRAGSVELGDDGLIADIIESKEEDAARREKGLASTNLYVLDTRVFSCPLIPKHEGSLEFGLPQTVIAGAKQLGIPFEPIFTNRWIQITAPSDLARAAEMLKNA